MEVKILNGLVMGIIFMFVSFSFESEYGNIVIKGGNNTINLIFAPNEYTNNAKIAYTESIEKSFHNLYQRLINTTADILEDSQHYITETPSIVSSTVSNKDSIEITTETSNEQTMKNYNPDECGMLSKSSVVWPWWAPILKLWLNGPLEYHCEGTLITPNSVLSASRCFHSEEYRVGLGFSDRRIINESNTFIAKINGLLIDPKYHGNDSTNGKFNEEYIAIVFLDKSYPISTRVRPACVWFHSKDQIEFEEGHVVGFPYEELYLELRTFEVKIESSENCFKEKLSSKSKSSILERNFCTINTNSEDLCFGVLPGQGLMVKRNEKFYLRGVFLGWPTKDLPCRPNVYTYYAYVDKFLTWLAEN